MQTRGKEDGRKMEAFQLFFPLLFSFSPLSFFFLFFCNFSSKATAFRECKKKKEKKNIKKRKREMEGWLMSETRHGISWQRGIFADKFFPFPGKVGKIVEDSFPFFLLYFILSPVPSAKTRNFYSIPLLDEWTTVTRFIPWWKDSQLKSLGWGWRWCNASKVAGKGGSFVSYIDTKRGEIVISLGWRR